MQCSEGQVGFFQLLFIVFLISTKKGFIEGSEGQVGLFQKGFFVNFSG